MKSIFFFDIDGTLLDTAKGERYLPKQVFCSIKRLRQAGNIVAACTARPQRFIEMILPNIFNCAILLNGSFVTVGDDILIDEPLSMDRVCELSSYFSLTRTGHIYIGNSSSWAYNISPKYRKILDDIYMVGDGYTRFEPISKGSAYAVDLFFESVNDFARISQSMANNCGLTLNYHVGDYTGDISFSERNKASAIPRILKYYNIDINNSYAFGDGLNDFYVFQTVPNTCAVGNATVQLKSIASFVSNARVGNGVIEGLQHWGYNI